MYWMLLTLLVLLIIYFIWENMVFEKKYYDIKIPHLPSGLDGVKICHISDLHLPHNGVNLKELTAAIIEDNPDLIVITGDIFGDDIDRDNQNAVRYLGQSLNEVAPIYAVSGNNDLPYMEGDKWRRSLEAHGINVLLDEAAYIKINGEILVLLGLKETPEMNDYAVVPESRNFMENIQVKDQYKDRPQILLAHHPEFFENYIRHSNVDLVLSGHTHGGQIHLPFIGGVFAPGQKFNPYYDYGIFASKEEPAKRMVINRGLATTKFTFRMLNKMEVTFITLH